MHTSAPTLTVMSSMKIIKKMIRIKYSSASIQLSNFNLPLKSSSLIKDSDMGEIF